MSNHTAGPWEVRPLEMFENDDIGVQIVAADGTVIADNQTYYPQALALENAPLIAAAPDMLAALQEQHKAIDILMAMLIEANTGFMPTQSVVWTAVVAGQAAILKATGGPQ